MVSPAKERFTLFTNKLLIYPGMRQDGPIRKGSVFLFQIYILLLTLTAWVTGMTALVQFGILMLVSGLIASIAYAISRKDNPAWLSFSGMVVWVLVTFYFIADAGGISRSGGLIFIGPAIIILSISLPRPDWTRWLTVLFVAGVIVTSLASPINSETIHAATVQNHIFFTMNAVFLGIFISIFLMQFAGLSLELNTARSHIAEEKKTSLRFKSKAISDLTDSAIGHLTTLNRQISEAMEADGGDQEEALGLAKNAGIRLERHLILAKEFTEVESGNVRIRKTQSDFIKFSKYLGDELNAQLNKKQIQVITQANINQFNLDFDPAVTQRIFSCLVADSVRRSNTPGQIKITINREQENSWSDLLDITISGNGALLEGHLAELLHKPDFEALIKDELLMAGTAPELAIAGELIRLLGGRIYLKSKENKGTLFRILIPAQNASRFLGYSDLIASFSIPPMYLPSNGRNTTGEKAATMGIRNKSIPSLS